MTEPEEIEPARSFDRAAAEYERARPSYPAGLLDLLPIEPTATVLDLGAGTGKLTRVLTTRYARVIAVEPLDGMRAILERVVPEADTHAGTAEQIPLPDASVDGVFAGQAFHWFANDEAVAEIARVLRPRGALCLVWNDTIDPSPLPKPYDDRLRTLYPETRAGVDEPDWPAIVARGPFGEINRGAVDHEQVQERGVVLEFAQSMSWIARRPDEERAEIMDGLDDLLTDGPFTFAMRANVMWAVHT